MIKKLKKRIARFGEKVSIIKGDISKISFDAEWCDVCILYYSFHEFSDQEKSADTISRAVRRGGIISIYEPTIEVGRHSMQETVSMFTRRGFSKMAERTTIFTRFVRLKKMAPTVDAPGSLPNRTA